MFNELRYRVTFHASKEGPVEASRSISCMWPILPWEITHPVIPAEVNPDRVVVHRIVGCNTTVHLHGSPVRQSPRIGDNDTIQ